MGESLDPPADYKVKGTDVEQGKNRRLNLAGRTVLHLDPRFVIVSRKGPKPQPVMLQAMRSGYIYDPKRNYIGTTYPHLRPAFKDGFYEHPCDSFLYGIIAFASPDPARDAGHVRTQDAVREAIKLL